MVKLWLLKTAILVRTHILRFSRIITKDPCISGHNSTNPDFAKESRNTGIPSYGHRQLPNNFLFLSELHFGGCGTYTSSDPWADAFGTAIGLR